MSKKHFNVLALIVGLVVISGGSIHLQAQKRHARSKATKPAAQNYSNVQARAGETLTALAERAGFNPLQLARLNGLSVNSKLKAGQLIIVPARGSSSIHRSARETYTKRQVNHLR